MHTVTTWSEFEIVLVYEHQCLFTHMYDKRVETTARHTFFTEFSSSRAMFAASINALRIFFEHV